MFRIARTFVLVFALAFVLPMAQLAQAQAPLEVPETYELGVNDEIMVIVYGPQNVEVRTRIREDGTIAFPFLVSVEAAGYTTRSLADTIAMRLRNGGYYVSPTVKVDIASYVSNAITVTGYVSAPGIIPLDREMTVATAVARAGGIKGDGGDYVLLSRKGSTEPIRIAITEVNAPAVGANIIVKAGDTIVVPQSPLVYVYGQVNSPGAFIMRPGMTVRQALARAGGPTLAGSQRRIRITRNGEKIKRVDLDSDLEPEDTLFIPERIF